MGILRREAKIEINQALAEANIPKSCIGWTGDGALHILSPHTEEVVIHIPHVMHAPVLDDIKRKIANLGRAQ